MEKIIALAPLVPPILLIITIFFFYRYILNLYGTSQLFPNDAKFFRTSFPSECKNLIKASDVLKSLGNELKLITIAKSDQELLYQNGTYIEVDEDILSLRLIFNSEAPNSNFSLAYDNAFHTTSIDENSCIYCINIKKDVGSLLLSGLRINNLIIEGNIQYLMIANCWINSIDFKCKSHSILNVHYSCIQFLDISNVNLSDTEFKNSNVISLKSPLKDSGFSICGDVNFENTSLGDSDNSLHDLRNLKRNLDDNSNHRASSYVGAFEKRILRGSLKGISKFVDYMYDTISFYNNSPERILSFIGFIFLIMYECIIVFNISLCANGEIVSIDTDYVSYIYNAFLYLFQSVISPIETIKGEVYFELKNVTLRFIYGIFSIVILLLMTLYVFALKRRYQES